MFRQSSNKFIQPLASVLRASRPRTYCCDKTKKPEPLCKHHKELVPCFSDIAKLKTFELKSDCTMFYIKSEGASAQKGPCPDKK